jgi:TonB family protein
VSDAVVRVLRDRQALDGGFQGGLLVSSAAHGLVVLVALVGHLIFPSEPPLRVQDGFVVALPPGGGGRPNAKPRPAPSQPPAATPAPDVPEPPEPEPPAKVVKPPREAPKTGLPDPETSRKARPEKTPPPRPAAGGAPGGTGTSSQTPGLAFGPPGPGVPGGTDLFGDWYMAGVQRKIWMLWSQQVRGVTSKEVVVSFTILADGSVADVHPVQPSGIFLLDQAAQRAILSAAPFGPLPKDYGTNRVTIQAIFRPAS